VHAYRWGMPPPSGCNPLMETHLQHPPSPSAVAPVLLSGLPYPQPPSDSKQMPLANAPEALGASSCAARGIGCLPPPRPRGWVPPAAPPEALGASSCPPRGIGCLQLHGARHWVPPAAPPEALGASSWPPRGIGCLQLPHPVDTTPQHRTPAQPTPSLLLGEWSYPPPPLTRLPPSHRQSAARQGMPPPSGYTPHTATCLQHAPSPLPPRQPQCP
jgi:hypothetical protein